MSMKLKFEWITPLYSTHPLLTSYYFCYILLYKIFMLSEEINIFHYWERHHMFWSKKNMRFVKFLVLRGLHISPWCLISDFSLGLLCEATSSLVLHTHLTTSLQKHSQWTYSERIQTQSVFHRVFSDYYSIRG